MPSRMCRIGSRDAVQDNRGWWARECTINIFVELLATEVRKKLSFPIEKIGGCEFEGDEMMRMSKRGG